MSIKPTKRLLNERNGEQVNKINLALNAGDAEVNDEDCPWVKIGGVCVSVSIVGKNSWLPLVSLLSSMPENTTQSFLIEALDKRAKALGRATPHDPRRFVTKHKRYVVFTGRHGDIPNVVDDNLVVGDEKQPNTTVGVFDRAHYEEDELVRDRALMEFPGIEIELVDTGTVPRNQTAWLRRETQRHILAHKTVIYAWCYGLFSMCEMTANRFRTTAVPPDLEARRVFAGEGFNARGKKLDADGRVVPEKPKTAAQVLEESHNMALITKTVGELVREYWSWVPIPIM